MSRQHIDLRLATIHTCDDNQCEAQLTINHQHPYDTLTPSDWDNTLEEAARLEHNRTVELVQQGWSEWGGRWDVTDGTRNFYHYCPQHHPPAWLHVTRLHAPNPWRD